MVKSAIKVYARLKSEKNRKNLLPYRIHHRPKENLEEDFLYLLAPSQKTKDYPDNRAESWNFSFFQIFEETTTQEDVFADVARPVVESALDGYNGTIFAYGQTASGKTYSITGEQKDRGIIPRSLQYLFDVIRKRPENVYSVEVAYLEIYNENGYDLLDQKQQREFAVTRLEDLPRVTIQEDEHGNLHIKNLSFHCISSVEDAYELFLAGNSNRITSETPLNPQSSRSHCIFTIVVSAKQFGEDQYKRAKVHLVDLAGSERVHKSSINGTILTEAKHINLSLHYLEQVIVCLAQESTGHIPYRNCLLTSILRDSLGGNSLTIMLATLSVTSINLEETVSTCRFAQRVALIKNDLKQVLEKNANSENVLLRLENERLKQQIRSMTTQLTSPEELTAEDKRILDSQIINFLESDTQISWNYDPKKVQYCFEAFRRTFELNKDANSCLKKLEYYKDMVVQRDKEISLLIDMLKKEKGKKNQKRKEGSVQLDTEGYLKSTEESVAANANFKEPPLSVEFNQNNASSIVEGNKEPVIQENGTSIEGNVMMRDNTTTVTNDQEDKVVPPFNRTVVSKKHRRKPIVPKLVLQNHVAESPWDVSIDNLKKSDGGRKNSNRNEQSSTNKFISTENIKQNLLSSNVINLSFNNTSTHKVKLSARSLNDTSITSSTQSACNFDKRGAKCVEVQASTKKVSETNIKKGREKSINVKSQNDKIEIPNTSQQIKETDCSPQFYQKLLNFNIPKNPMKSTQNEISRDKSLHLINEIQSCNFKRDSNLECYEMKSNSACLDDKACNSIELNNAGKSQNVKAIAAETNTQGEYYNNTLDSGRSSNRSQNKCPTQRKKSITNFMENYSGRSCSLNGSARIEKEDSNQTPKYSENIKNFESSLPLTGDLEIDEEIIAFYKAKRSGCDY